MLRVYIPRRGVSIDGDHNCIGYRPIVDGIAQDFTFFTYVSPVVVMVYSYNETNEMIRALGSALKEKNLVPENDDSDLKVSDGEHVWISALLHPLVPSRWHLLPHSLRVGPRRVQLLLHQQCCCDSLWFSGTRVLRVCCEVLLDGH